MTRLDTRHGFQFIEEEGEHGSSLEPAHREPAVKETVMTVEEASTTAAPAPPTTTEDTEEANQGFKGEKAEYCDNYEQHFSFYCVGDHSNDLVSLCGSTNFPKTR